MQGFGGHLQTQLVVAIPPPVIGGALIHEIAGGLSDFGGAKVPVGDKWPVDQGIPVFMQGRQICENG